MGNKWADKFTEWLENVIAESNMPLDEHWETERIEEGENVIIRASNPKQPFDVYIDVGKNFATLYIVTGIETATLDNQERLKIYRDLLLLSGRWRMVKYVLEGEEDEIVIKTDLDLSSLGKEEFNHAITVTLIAMNDLVKKLDMEEIYQEAQLAHVIEIIREKAEKGESKKDIVDFLMRIFGINEDAANEIVTVTLEEKKKDLGYIR